MCRMGSVNDDYFFGNLTDFTGRFSHKIFRVKVNICYSSKLLVLIALLLQSHNATMEQRTGPEFCGR